MPRQSIPPIRIQRRFGAMHLQAVETHSNAVFLITGGAGSIGSALAEGIFKRYHPKTIRLFDNSDYGLAKVSRQLQRAEKASLHTDTLNKRIRRRTEFRYLLGNLQDYQRLEMAVKGVDHVIHAAAIKDISVSEYNPIETIKTNVNGTINLMEACFRHEPEKVLFVSSDKSVDFTSLYGATKFIGEQITLWSHRISHPEIKFSSARFGNVMQSRGNVFEIWREQNEKCEAFTITDLEMKRYFWRVDEAIAFVIEVFEAMEGGEIFVPTNMRELQLKELMDGRAYEIIGRRPGEKMEERLLTEEEEERAERRENYWIIR